MSSSEQLKEITESLTRVVERLDKIESRNPVYEGHSGYSGATAGFPYQYWQHQGLWRSASSPSILKDSREHNNEEVEEGEDQEPSLQGKGAVGGATRPRQAGGPAGQPPFVPRFPGAFHQLQHCQQFAPPFMSSQLVFMVDPRGPASSQPDYKARFESIRSSVSKTILDSDWSFSDSKAGIASSDRELAAVISRSAKYVETELKLMQEVQKVFDQEDKVAECMDQLHSVQKAHMRYLQEEFNSLQVGGQYGAQAKSVFKAISRNTSVYTPAFIDDIKTVLNITGNSQPQQQQQRGRGNSFRPRFQSSRFPHNTQFRPRRFPAPFQGYQPRSVPSSREDSDQ